MLPILQKQSTAPTESFSESMSFENMKSETELKHYVMTMVDDPVKKKKIKDLFDDFQNSAILSKNNLNFPCKKNENFITNKMTKRVVNELKTVNIK